MSSLFRLYTVLDGYSSELPMPPSLLSLLLSASQHPSFSSKIFKYFF